VSGAKYVKFDRAYYVKNLEKFSVPAKYVLPATKAEAEKGLGMKLLAGLLLACLSAMPAGAMVLCPDGNYALTACPPSPPRPLTLCPDGSYVVGQCVLAPNGRYVGR
jgi:hypothetical protein